jgi:hypothetical protein
MAKTACLAVSAFLTFLAPPGHAEERATLDRPYDPVVIPCSSLQGLLGTPVEDIRICAYRASEGRWEGIPFQLDERKAIVDPWDPPNLRLSYFDPDDGLLDADDELCFLCRDAGDRSGPSDWPDLPGCRAFARVELELYDPLDGGRAWVYAYRCSGQSPPIPAPYCLSYDAAHDEVSSVAYRVRLGANTGLVEDVAILPPFGSGVDFFDTQKIRMVGLLTAFNLTLPFGRDWSPYAANERDNLFIYPDSTRWTLRPVVRVVRQALQAVRFGAFVFGDARFPVETKFYPFFGRVSGGTDLSTLGELVDVEVDLLRQSWDFNANAVGMRLSTRRNRELRIDGVPDAFDSRVDLPIREWFLVTGEQGSLFVRLALVDTIGTSQSLYYRDDRNGGQSDGTLVHGGDTGYDGASYGDVGVLATGRVARPNLQLDFAAYFLPADQPPEAGERLAAWLGTPVTVAATTQAPSGVAASARGVLLPDAVEFSAAFPNPFRVVTSFRVWLEGPGEVVVQVVDVAGRRVRLLHQGSLPHGGREFRWDGRDDDGAALPSGRYFVTVRAGGQVRTRPVVLLR